MPRKSDLGNFTLWEKQQMSRIAKLSDRSVLRELRSIMNGEIYSWGRISQLLKHRFDEKLLVLEHFEPGNILYEWNVLCDEKRHWSHHKRPSFKSLKFNRDSLIKLKIIPTQAGLGIEGNSRGPFLGDGRC